MELPKKLASSARKYYSILNRFVSDELVLRELIQEEKYGGKEPQLKIPSIEKRTKLPPLPKEPVREHIIQRALGEFSHLPITLDNSSFRKQISSLIHTRDQDDQEGSLLEEELAYFLSRVIAGRLPRNPRWIIHQQDIDHFTASLFLIQNIANIVGANLNWLDILNNPISGQYPTTIPKLVPTPDSAMQKDIHPIIVKAKGEIGIPGFEPLQKLCRILNQTKELKSITYQDMMEHVGGASSRARYISSVMDSILNERILLIPKILGLKHRWIITEKARKFHTSAGLVERFDCRPYEEMIEERRRYKWGDVDRHRIDVPNEYRKQIDGNLSVDEIEKSYKDNLRQRGLSSLERIIESKKTLQETENRTVEESNELAELQKLEMKLKTIITREMKEEFSTYANMEGATVHLEPKNSPGPINLPLGATDFVTNEEFISYRLDLFDSSENQWRFQPWNPTTPAEENNWINLDTSKIKGKEIHLSDDDVFILASLFLSRGSSGYRSLVQSVLDFDSRVLSQILTKFTDSSAIVPLYYPSLEYSGLTEGCLIIAPSLETRELTRMKKWLLEISPFIHLYWRKEGAMAARILVPTGKGGFMLSVIHNEIMKKWQNCEIYLGSVKQEISYYFTMPSKLFDSKTQTWRDPWES